MAQVLYTCKSGINKQSLNKLIDLYRGDYI